MFPTRFPVRAVLGLALAGAATLAAGQAPESSLLIGRAVGHELAAGGRHDYVLNLPTGHFGQILIRQCGMDVSLELHSPDGKLLARRDDTYSFGREALSFVSESAGTYRVSVVASAFAAAPGPYEIRLVELRPATPRDRQRIAAEAETSRALQLRDERGPDARRRAREGLQRATRQWHELGDARGEAFALHGLAWEERLAGNMPRALELIRRALPLAQRSEDRQLEGRVLNVTGLLVTLVGDPKAALEAEARALPLLRSEGDEDAEAAALRYRGLAAWMMADFQKALDWSNEALAIARRIHNVTEEAWAIFQIATAHWSLADYPTALRYYERSLPLFQIVGDAEGEMLTVNALGGTYISVGAPQRTLDVEQPALEAIRALGSRAEEANALGNIGQALADLGRGEEALAPLSKARAIWKSMGDRREIWSLWHLSRALSTMGRTEDALASYRELLAFGRRIGDRGLEMDALAALARLEASRGNLEEARARAEEAVAIVESSRGTIHSPTLRSLYTASRQAAYDIYASVLAALDVEHPERKLGEAAFAAMERGRARTVTEAIADTQLDLASDLSPELRKKEAELSARLTSLQSKVPFAGGGRGAAEEALADAEEEWDRLIAEIRRSTPRYAAIQYPEPVSASSVRSLLDPSTALVAFAVRSKRPLAFLVTRDRLDVIRLSVSGPPLSEQIENYVGLISRDERDAWATFSASLYAQLIAPWRGRLPASIRRLVIVPDGALHSLPFETLAPAGRGGARLVDELSISYAPSATVLAQLERGRSRPAGAKAARLLVLASPPVPAAMVKNRGELDGETYDLSPLGYASGEARAVSRFGGEGSVAYFGEQASESGMSRWPLDRFDVIHFATHALLNPRVPSRSALLLAGREGGEKEDGLLRARDVYRLRLGVDLVVLSACSTARGQILPGEGVQGLAQAFFHAGARSVVASLWDVNDRRTADFMSSFYEHLAGGEAKADALRSAKRDLLRREPQLAPRYWAAFVLLGDPTGDIALQMPRPSLIWVFAGALAVVLAGIGTMRAVARQRRRAKE